MTKEQVGSLAWMRATHGRLSWSARVSLMRQALVPGMVGFARAVAGRGAQVAVRLQELPLPDSAAVKHALAELESAASPSLVNHSLRTYLWGAALGSVGGLRHDPEFLMVSCLLHDLGMTDRHRTHAPACRCFAGQSALAALDCMKRFGWPDERATRLADGISLHLNGHLPLRPGGDIEAHLLQQGTAVDVAGHRLHDLARGFRDEVLAQHPRLGFNRVFTDFLGDEKKRHPQSRAALLCQLGLPLMIKFNPYQD